MNKDLTVGNPSKVLIEFTIPQFISVIFQQIYQITDSIIAGKFAGEAALAAVGASYPITMIFMAIAMGCQIGCSVVISYFFGSAKIKETKTTITTALISALILSSVLTILGFLLSSPLMKLIKTPEDIFADGNTYLRIYIAGFIFLFLYNIITGIFSSLGDSKTPLILLIGSSLANVVLDAVFVIKFGFGVAGVAWATFIAQGASCILGFILLVFRVKKMKCEEKPNLFSFASLKKITSISIPCVLQQSFVSIGNMFIQFKINGYGSSVIAGYSAAIKLNTFAVTSFATLGNGMSSFTAQNIGAGKTERVTKAFKNAMLFTMSIACVFFLSYFICGKYLLKLFMNKDSTALALETGLKFLKIVSPFYFAVCLKLMCDGVLKGGEAMKYFMSTTFTDLILRVVLAFIFASFLDSLGIWLAWPISWVVSAIMSLCFYLKNVWNRDSKKS